MKFKYLLLTMIFISAHLLVLLSSGPGCCPNLARPGDLVVMGFAPSLDEEIVQEHGDKLAEILTAKTGIPIKAYVTNEYSALVTAMETGQVDVAWLPVLPLVQAEERAGAVVLLKAVRNNNPFYYGAIIVNENSPYYELEDLRGVTIAWGDPTSTSGHIFPKNGLIRMGIDPDGFFSDQLHTGSHDAVLRAVLTEQVDAGAVYSNDTEGDDGAWTQLLRPEDQKKIRPIWYTDPIPGDTLAVSGSFWAGRHAEAVALKDAIMSLHDDPEGARILMDLYHIEKMIPATTYDFDVVRAAAGNVLRD